MNGIVSKVADRCGDFMMYMGKEATQLANSVNYQAWLVLSTLVVMIGFYFLKSGR